MPGYGVKATLSLGVGLTALLTGFGSPAFAQAESEEDTSRLATVTVTATRRPAVDVQDVPASISVYDSGALDRADIEALTDLTQLSPSLVAVTAQNPSATRIGIRGISTSANNIGFEAAVGVSIDGVARSRTGIALSELPELSSVEVLRGPQGTLFGRNTSAGVIVINTAKPDPDGGGFLRGSYGNFDAYSIDGAINLPISEEWTGRVDARYRERGGFLDDVNSSREVNNIERSVIRGQLAYQGDAMDVRLIADYSTSDSDCCGAVATILGPTAPAVSGISAASGNLGFGSTDLADYEVALTPGRELSDKVDDWGISAEINREFGGLNATSITAYRQWQSDQLRDGDFSGVDYVASGFDEIDNSTLSQEFRLQGENGRIDWLVGLFALRDVVELDNGINVGEDFARYTDTFFLASGTSAFGTTPGAPSILARVNPALATRFFTPFAPETGAASSFELTTEALALFTHNQITLTDKLSATVGLRYTTEDKELDYSGSSATGNDPFQPCNFFSANPGVAPALGGASILLCNPAVNSEADFSDTDDRTDSALSGTFVLSGQVTEDALVYGSYSRGFKSGGYNLNRSGFSYSQFGNDPASLDDLDFDEETVDAFEIGWNTEWLDRRLILNGAAFFQDITNLQQVSFNGTNFEVNVADAESFGVELDSLAQVSSELSLQLGYAYTDISRTDTPEGAADSDEGEQFVTQPKHSFTGAATYKTDLGSRFVATTHLNGRYVTEQNLGAADFTQDAFLLLNGRLTLEPTDSRWELSLFAENILDEDYGAVSFGLTQQPGTTAVFPGTPALYGVELRVDF